MRQRCVVIYGHNLAAHIPSAGHTVSNMQTPDYYTCLLGSYMRATTLSLS